jgi:hypothetical protein
MSTESARRIFINHRPYMVDSQPLTGERLAAFAGVPRDNVVVEVETPTGLDMVALDEVLEFGHEPRFLVTRQFIMGGSS